MDVSRVCAAAPASLWAPPAHTVSLLVCPSLTQCPHSPAPRAGPHVAVATRIPTPSDHLSRLGGWWEGSPKSPAPAPPLPPHPAVLTQPALGLETALRRRATSRARAGKESFKVRGPRAEPPRRLPPRTRDQCSPPRADTVSSISLPVSPDLTSTPLSRSLMLRSDRSVGGLRTGARGQAARRQLRGSARGVEAGGGSARLPGKTGWG